LQLCQEKGTFGVRLWLGGIQNGDGHAYVKLAAPLAEFFGQATASEMTQHWALIHADDVQELIALVNIMGLARLIL